MSSKELNSSIQRVRRSLTRKLASIDKSISKTENQLLDAKNAEGLVHTADLIKTNLHAIPKNASKIIVQDWELEGKDRTVDLDPLISPREFMQKLYRRAHRLMRGIDRIALELEKLHARKAEVINLIAQYDAGNEIELSVQTPKKATQTPQSPYRAYLASTGEKILVGKDSKSNDLITFQVAKGDDLWLHVDKAPGSHVVIRRKNDEISPQAIEEAALLAAYFSKKRVMNTHVEIIIAKRSDVYRKKGMKSGQVLVRKQTTRSVNLNKERMEPILNAAFTT